MILNSFRGSGTQEQLSWGGWRLGCSPDVGPDCAIHFQGSTLPICTLVLTAGRTPRASPHPPLQRLLKRPHAAAGFPRSKWSKQTRQKHDVFCDLALGVTLCLHKLVPLATHIRRGLGLQEAPGRTLGTILEVGWYLKIKYLTPFYRNFHFRCRTQGFYLIYPILNLLYFILRILPIENIL